MATDVNIPAGIQTSTIVDQEYFKMNSENANIEAFWLQCAFCREALILNRFD
jgi:hypothetical protein